MRVRSCRALTPPPTTDLKPCLVTQTAEMIHVLTLGAKTDTGAYPVPDRPYTHVGDVVHLNVEYVGRDKMKRRRVEWWAYPRTEAKVGPFTTRPKAVEGLLTTLGLVQVSGTDTMEPMF